MEVYLIRHAEAVPLGQNGINADADRPLTEHGMAQTRALAATLQQRGVKLELILTSPYLRARQTAQGLVDQWIDTPTPQLELCDELLPAGKSGKLARVVRKLKRDSVALVGHMPDLAAHAAWLMGSKKAQLDFDKAGVASLHCPSSADKGGCVLEWLVTPEWFVVAERTPGHLSV